MSACRSASKCDFVVSRHTFEEDFPLAVKFGVVELAFADDGFLQPTLGRYCRSVNFLVLFVEFFVRHAVSLSRGS
jgi:hypothetical protein